ncbi:hypothetical protein NDI45_27000 [Leptolyngbya sp. GB1-A1]|uniref:hypothetical protein n=1 Tax=Leptolyngbya sp. GB1-A1 TaxID=2933908 RepID=UPI003297C1D3
MSHDRISPLPSQQLAQEVFQWRDNLTVHEAIEGHQIKKRDLMPSAILEIHPLVAQVLYIMGFQQGDDWISPKQEIEGNLTSKRLLPAFAIDISKILGR